MINQQHMDAVRKAVLNLRDLKLVLEAVEHEIDDDRTLLPEHRWRTAIDDDMIEVCVSLDAAILQIDEALDSLAEVTGEEGNGFEAEQQSANLPPLPRVRPTHEEVDARRREEAALIRARR